MDLLSLFRVYIVMFHFLFVIFACQNTEKRGSKEEETKEKIAQMNDLLKTRLKRIGLKLIVDTFHVYFQQLTNQHSLTRDVA